MNPAPTQAIPILGGGDSVPALRRAVTLCDGWINTGAAFPDDAFDQVELVRKSLHEVGRDGDDFAIYLAVKAFPDLDLYRRLEEAGVTDLLCAPWMLAEVDESDSPEKMLDARLAEVEKYAEEYVTKMG